MKNKGYKCKADGCVKDARARGYCHSHYRLVWAQGEFVDKDSNRIKNKGKDCSEEGCRNKANARGYCNSHYHILRARGEFEDLEKKQCKDNPLHHPKKGHRHVIFGDYPDVLV